jgi:hypothetical protein
MFWQDSSALQAGLRSSATEILNGGLYKAFQKKILFMYRVFSILHISHHLLRKLIFVLYLC